MPNPKPADIVTLERSLSRQISQPSPLDAGGGPPHDGGMDGERIGRLEGRMDRVDGKLDQVIAGLSGLRETTAALPTRRDLQTFALTGIGIALAVVAIVITGVVGGLAWIQPQPAPAPAAAPFAATPPAAPTIIYLTPPNPVPPLPSPPAP